MQINELTNYDAFQVHGMTETINRLPMTPGRISRSGLFNEEGIETTYVNLEYRENQIQLVPNAKRGAPGARPPEDKRGKITVEATHLPQEDHLEADAVQNLKAFGRETELDMLQRKVNRRLGNLRTNIDVTMEYQRVGAINGLVLDSDGKTVIYDMFDRFNLNRTTHEVDFSAKKLKTSLLKAKTKIEDVLGGYSANAWWCLTGRNFMYTLLENDDFNRAYERYNDGAVLREDQRFGIPYCDIFFETYSGHLKNVPFIPDNEARLIPMGLTNLFITKFAPANYAETVNTTGLPYYAKMEMSKFNKGMDIEAQSNPINWCTMPDSVCHLSIKGSGN